MGEHRGNLKKIENWIKGYLVSNGYDIKDNKLKNIYSSDGTPFATNDIACNDKKGNKIYIEIIGWEDWRATLGKIFAFAYDLKMVSKYKRWEIWLVTDEKNKNKLWTKQWCKQIKIIIKDMLGNSVCERVKFYYIVDNRWRHIY